MDGYDVTPEQASHGRSVPERELPMLAAQWLVGGYDSPLLRELAALSPSEALGAVVPFRDVLDELGFPVRETPSPYEESPWRGQWHGIWWAVDQMDRHTYSPYAAAQYIVEIVGDHEALWAPGGGDRLMALLRAWDVARDRRSEIDAQIKTHLHGLRESQVPPLSESP